VHKRGVIGPGNGGNQKVSVTIKDIARVAGVSHTTVSRALKGNPSISSTTTSRVQQIAHDMGYTPSAVAQSLLTQRTQSIGMVITTIADPFVVDVVAGVEAVAQEANYSVFLATSHNNPDQEMTVVETLHRRRVDAIIVTSSRVGSLYSSRLDRIKVPIVLINNNQEDGDYLYSVAADDVQGARLAVSHLIQLGHKKIGYVGVKNRPNSNEHRLTGYRMALTEAGIEVAPGLILLPDAETDIERGRIGFALVKQGATAIFCYNDLIAIGLQTAAQRRNCAVPAQLSIVGFDNIEPSTYVNPPLTTVAQPLFELGQQAMTMALSLLEGGMAQDQVLPCELLVRGSTAALAW
jgi:DNA-binding LacI/PurR family transcriptional regulator